MPATPDGGWILDDREIEKGFLTPEEREALLRRPFDPSKKSKEMPKFPEEV